MGRLDDRARARLALWLAARTDFTQETIGSALGKPQGFISRYLKGQHRLTLDELEIAARVFGHTIGELLDSPTDPQEAALLDRFRAMTPSTRAKLVAFLDEWAGPRRPRRRA